MLPKKETIIAAVRGFTTSSHLNSVIILKDTNQLYNFPDNSVFLILKHVSGALCYTNSDDTEISKPQPWLTDKSIN